MKVRYISPDGRKSYDLKIGWSWTLFFFWSFFGIPFYCRGMVKWALFGCAYTVSYYIVESLDQDLGVVMALAQLGFSIYLGMKGNALTEDDLLSRGWKQETAEQYKARTGRNPVFVAS